jgi:hypothetical protein
MFAVLSLTSTSGSDECWQGHRHGHWGAVGLRRWRGRRG